MTTKLFVENKLAEKNRYGLYYLECFQYGGGRREGTSDTDTDIDTLSFSEIWYM